MQGAGLAVGDKRLFGPRFGACLVGLGCVGPALVGRFRLARMGKNGPEDGPLNRSKGS